jgi:hypothetical protein
MKEENVKQKISELIDKASIFTKEAAHSMVEKTSKISSSIKESIDDMQDVISKKWNEKSTDELEPGDLVYAEHNINLENYKTILAGEIFMFKEDMASQIKVPLYTPDVNRAVRFSRITELQTFFKELMIEASKRTDGRITMEDIRSCYNKRLTELQTPESNEQNAESTTA